MYGLGQGIMVLVVTKAAKNLMGDEVPAMHSSTRIAFAG